MTSQVLGLGLGLGLGLVGHVLDSISAVHTRSHPAVADTARGVC